MPQLNKHTLNFLPFCILGFDWTSSITVVTVSAYISLAGFATHCKIKNKTTKIHNLSPLFGLNEQCNVKTMWHKFHSPIFLWILASNDCHTFYTKLFLTWYVPVTSHEKLKLLNVSQHIYETVINYHNYLGEGGNSIWHYFSLPSAK